MKFGRVWLRTGAIVLVGLAGPALAQAPELSPRPLSRPLPETTPPMARPALTIMPEHAPRRRPAGQGAGGAVAVPPPVALPEIILPQLGRLALASVPPPGLQPVAPAALPQAEGLALPVAPPPGLVAPDAARSVQQPLVADAAVPQDWQPTAAPSHRPVLRKEGVAPGLAALSRPVALPGDPGFERSAPPPARGAEPEEAAVLQDGPAQRPKARPAGLMASAAPAPGMAARLVAALRPEPRPAGLVRKARPAAQPENLAPVAAIIRPAPGTGPVTGRRGSVCGVPGIQGETIGPIVARVGGCGVPNPVRITSVAGVKLSQPSIVDCDTARALNAWVERGLKPAFGATGGGVAGLQIAGHYVCRTRNHKKGARLSEHSRGKAIDISAIILANGQALSILRDYRGRSGQPIRQAHKAACGIFGTTLGPGSDGMHEDHLHFDTARHRNGPYCR